MNFVCVSSLLPLILAGNSLREWSALSHGFTLHCLYLRLSARNIWPQQASGVIHNTIWDGKRVNYEIFFFFKSTLAANQLRTVAVGGVYESSTQHWDQRHPPFPGTTMDKQQDMPACTQDIFFLHLSQKSVIVASELWTRFTFPICWAQNLWQTGYFCHI